MAYFAITPTQIGREEDGISTSAAVLDRVPAFMIAKLAVDKSIQNQGLGKELAFDAITRIVGVAQLGGCCPSLSVTMLSSSVVMMTDR